MNTRYVFITQGEFESYLECGRLYEGFVIGLGYAYIRSKYTQPPNIKGSTRYNDIGYNQNQFGIVKFQCLDSSPPMVVYSFKVHTSCAFAPYTVCIGDTLSTIAENIGVTVDDIIQWNGIRNPNFIRPGQILMIDLNKAKYWNKVVSNSIQITNSPTNNQDDVDVLGISCSLFSLGVESVLLAKNYNYLSSLMRNGQFLGMKNEIMIVMDKSFLSTRRMIRERTPMRDKFLRNTNRLGWLGKVGIGASALPTGISMYNLATAETTEERWIYGADTIYGIAGFLGPIGAFISFNYTIGKAMLPDIINDNIERADRISRGDYSMAWYIPGRSVR